MFNKSIKHKVISVIISVALLIIVLSSFSTIPPTIDLYKKTIEKKLNTASAIIGMQSNAIIDFGSSELGKSLLENLKSIKEIEYAFIYKYGGEFFASYKRNKTDTFIQSYAILNSKFKGKNQIFAYDKTYIYVRKDIANSTGAIGTLFIQANMSDLNFTLRDYIYNHIFFSILLLIIALLISNKLQSFITRPILSLNEKIQMISDTKDYSIKVSHNLNDETGILCNNFNRMIETIDKKENEIKEINEQLEHKIKVRTKDLEMAKTEAENANKLKSKFIANVSHEIRTPLNAILGFTQILNSYELIDDFIRERIKIIDNSGHYLLNLVNNILDMSKLEAELTKLSMHQFDIVKMITSIQSMFIGNFEKKGIDFFSEISPKLNKYYIGDSQKIKQCLINLIGNAYKFTDNGFVKLKVKQKKNGLLFSVEDTGRGIEEERLEEILKPFTQIELKNVNTESGTGLGLAITNQFIKLMGSKIEILSTADKGSIFSFVLKLKASGNESVEENDLDKIVNKSISVTVDMINYDNIKNELSEEYIESLEEKFSIGDYLGIKNKLKEIEKTNDDILRFIDLFSIYIDNFDDQAIQNIFSELH